MARFSVPLVENIKTAGPAGYGDGLPTTTISGAPSPSTSPIAGKVFAKPSSGTTGKPATSVPSRRKAKRQAPPAVTTSKSPSPSKSASDGGVAVKLALLRGHPGRWAPDPE